MQDTPPFSVKKRRSSNLKTLKNCVYSSTDGRHVHRVDPATGEKSVYNVNKHEISHKASWCEVSKGVLAITGGDLLGKYLSKFVTLDIWRELSCVDRPPMLIARYWHGAIGLRSYLYVFGGVSGVPLKEAERFNPSTSKWEDLPPMPIACYGMSMGYLESTSSIYLLGGFNTYIQVFDVERTLWSLAKVALPTPERFFPTFKVNELKIFLVSRSSQIYVYDPHRETLDFVKAMAETMQSSFGFGIWSRGAVYYPTINGPVKSYVVGDLAGY
mmetsp:Transcript_16945/g.30429  ORF Transcript_16945/g.30429 Transcript_16945/m.30429 type:complete len:271 (+) Transcript_16945:1759-2571(+)|eukprot:CAMPEP_0204917624 /NCGR_PEP_ID=MMETSP1397-20131031/15229_1 /ASSEMBLY_ACC=CAM_ASM_000891 /TAXON_ID=49980 /ORGANISM="Climacostomum Climacostomum virens, Strain Stock W-24" /LENGTH=270 /DNA_ID=CAMNT_0052090515 /DNA_START=291 /DNA_END=1103 /DNA_ORIENTATION=-